jgi:hypothetical protein
MDNISLTGIVTMNSPSLYNEHILVKKLKGKKLSSFALETQDAIQLPKEDLSPEWFAFFLWHLGYQSTSTKSQGNRTQNGCQSATPG